MQQERVMGWLLVVPGLLMIALSFVGSDGLSEGRLPLGIGVGLAAMFVVRSILRARHRLVVEVPEERTPRDFVLRRVVPAVVIFVLVVAVHVVADGESLGLLGVIYAGFGIAALGRASVIARGLGTAH